MAWLLPDGRKLNSPRNVVVNGSTIKSSAFSNKEYIASKGIYEFRENNFDQTFYISLGFTDENINGDIIRTHNIGPKYSLEELKQIKIRDVKAVAASKLSSTDWLVIRKSEANTDIPNDVLLYRTAVRSASNDIEACILNYDDYGELIKASFENLWPEPLEV